jgi:hypothetical protein
MSDYVFKRPNEEYEINLAPVKDYFAQATEFLAIDKGIPIEQANKLVKTILKKQPIKNPIIKYSHREENGDTVVKEDKITDYIKDVIANGEVIVPSFTCYMHPSKKKSLHADFLSINIALRKQDKHNAFKFKQAGDGDRSLYYETLQKTRKIQNNSLSGAYASKSTILYNPTAHYTLTSITRSVASIGNAISESVIAGNKHLRSPEIMYNYIVSIVSNLHMNTVEHVIEKYKLHKPTATEVFDSLIYSSKHYWRDPVFEKTILDFLMKLTPYQLAAVMYLNDLHHLRIYNEEFIKTLLTKMSAKVTTGSVDNLKDLKKAPEGINILTHHIWIDEIRGMSIDYGELAKSNPDLLMSLASTSKHITDTLLEYKPFFRIFFTSSVMPAGIAYIKDMLRDAIVLSDTDSTCGSYDKWVEWYFGYTKFSPEAVGLAAAVMTINTQVVDHNLKLFARNMNVETSLVELLKMKNEYFWPVFTATNVSKHYFADTAVQEGNVFSEPELELKGVHLLASAIDQDIVKEGHNIIKEINKKISNNEKISLYEYVHKAAELERSLITRIKSGDISIFKRDKIKEAGSYKLDPAQSPFIHHMLWNEVFADKYGTPGDPTYMIIKIPTKLKSKKDTDEYLENLKDPEIKERLKNFMVKHNKPTLGTFRPAVSIVASSGIPEEIIEAIDMKRIVMDNLNMLYLVLESVGYYRHNGKLISESGY